MGHAGTKAKIVISKSRTKSAKARWTSAQSERFRELCDTIETLGFQVRREELRRGPCWKVQSGSCRLRSSRFVFVDSRLPPEEQIRFLATQAAIMKSPVASAQAAA
jgi:hypothetical protein